MEKDRNYWPLGIGIVFALFFISMACVVGIAARNQEHLVNDNYYEMELQYQNQINATARAIKSGASMDYDSTNKKLILHVSSGGNDRINGKISFFCPSNPKFDREFPMAPGNDGVQSLDISSLRPGPWTVNVCWKTGMEDYFLDRKIILPVN